MERRGVGAGGGGCVAAGNAVSGAAILPWYWTRRTPTVSGLRPHDLKIITIVEILLCTPPHSVVLSNLTWRCTAIQPTRGLRGMVTGESPVRVSTMPIETPRVPHASLSENPYFQFSVSRVMLISVFGLQHKVPVSPGVVGGLIVTLSH